MLIDSLYILIGFLALVWGGDRFVSGASALARNIGVSPLLVGLTIVAFGTSAPEIFVSLIASLKGNPGLAVGNAIGSNITNIGLVIGITALIKPLEVHSSILKREFPILFLVMGFSAILFWDGSLDRIDGVLLLTGLVLFLCWLIRLGLRQRSNGIMEKEYSAEIPRNMSTAVASGWTVLGLILLPIASEWVVLGASGIAHTLGVSDLIIGLTVVAIGTSLPELMTSLIGALKGEDDIAVGNILGSNLFNLLAVLGIPGLIHPDSFGKIVMWRDFPTMVILTVILYVFSFQRNGHGRISRLAGGFLLLGYCSYLGLLIITY